MMTRGPVAHANFKSALTGNASVPPIQLRRIGPKTKDSIMKKLRLVFALVLATGAFTACSTSMTAPDDCDETVEDCFTKPTSGS